MAERLSDSGVKNLPLPAKGNRITYDSDVKGFGARVTAAGGRAFILNYRTRSGRERRYTIGSFPDWKTTAARNEAAELRKAVDRGEDPLAGLEAERSAPTMADLCDRFEEEHLPSCRPSTRKDYKSLLDREIRPAFKHVKVADLDYDDVEGLHRKITKRGAPYIANRTVAVLGKMLTTAIKSKWRSDNPARGIKRNSEEKRDRYLTSKEIAALSAALVDHKDQQAVNIVRILLLTGARRGEVQAMKWADVDLEHGVWTKPASTTKTNKLHRVPLSDAARQLLRDIFATAEERAKEKKRPRPVGAYVFPGKGGAGHRIEIKHQWAELCKAAGIVTTHTARDTQGREIVITKPSARLHDLRHTYASVLASAGLSLPIIGALLGHSQPQTTARYAHLLDDPLRAATEQAAAIVTGKPSAEIYNLNRLRK